MSHICDFCGEEIEEIPFKCKYCGLTLCSNCRLPESHYCYGLKVYNAKKEEDFREKVSFVSKNYRKTNDRGYEVVVAKPKKSDVKNKRKKTEVTTFENESAESCDHIKNADILESNSSDISDVKPANSSLKGTVKSGTDEFEAANSNLKNTVKSDINEVETANSNLKDTVKSDTNEVEAANSNLKDTVKSDNRNKTNTKESSRDKRSSKKKKSHSEKKKASATSSTKNKNSHSNKNPNHSISSGQKKAPVSNNSKKIAIVLSLLCIGILTLYFMNGPGSDDLKSQNSDDNLPAPSPTSFNEIPIAKAGGESVLLINYRNATDPAWEELIGFLRDDQTDRLPYNDSFVCADFAEAVHNNAERKGIKAGYVLVEFSDMEPHGLNVFNTTDKGTVFVDCTGSENKLGPLDSNDKIAYIKIGNEFGLVSAYKTNSPDYEFYETYRRRKSQGVPGVYFEPLGIVKDTEIYW